MRKEEDGLPHSDAIMHSFVEDFESLAPQAQLYCSHCLDNVTRDQRHNEAYKHNKHNQSNLLNRSRSIKINDALTKTFM